MQLDATNPLSYPGTGTTVTDLTGGYNHTLTDAEMFKDIGGIKYFLFTEGFGNDKKMLVSGTGPVLNNGGYTYMMWVYSPISGANRWLVGGTANQPTFRTGVGVWIPVSNTGDINNTISTTIEAETWQQLTFTVNSSNVVTMFKNAAGAVGNTTPSGGMRGRNHVGFGQGTNNYGRVSICCLYDRVLTGAEITTNFNGLKGFFGL